MDIPLKRLRSIAHTLDSKELLKLMKRDNVRIDMINYYNGYLPVTKKKLEKLLKYRNSAIKKEEMSFFDEVLSLMHLKYFKSTD